MGRTQREGDLVRLSTKVQGVGLDAKAGLYDFFFFQAEDGIRDLTVTGVQTCALPISSATSPSSARWAIRIGSARAARSRSRARGPRTHRGRACASGRGARRPRSGAARSEERRVGEEGRSRWAPDHLKKKKDGIMECV